jgi:MYXO-CTERM domain-containing protein
LLNREQSFCFALHTTDGGSSSSGSLLLLQACAAAASRRRRRSAQQILSTPRDHPQDDFPPSCKRLARRQHRGGVHTHHLLNSLISVAGPAMIAKQVPREGTLTMDTKLQNLCEVKISPTPLRERWCSARG